MSPARPPCGNGGLRPPFPAGNRGFHAGFQRARQTVFRLGQRPQGQALMGDRGQDQRPGAPLPGHVATTSCAAMTPAFRERLAKGETLDDLLPEAFAVVREAAKRTLGQRHFDVQLVGGMVLHERQHLRDEDRRRQDPGRHPARLSQRPGRRRRACGDGQRLSGQARQRMDGPDLPLPGPERGLHRPWPGRRRAQATPMPPTSPTAPTTNSASTICATT